MAIMSLVSRFRIIFAPPSGLSLSSRDLERQEQFARAIETYVEERVNPVSSNISGLASQLSSINNRLSSIENSISRLESRINSIERDVRALED